MINNSVHYPNSFSGILVQMLFNYNNLITPGLFYKLLLLIKLLYIIIIINQYQY